MFTVFDSNGVGRPYSARSVADSRSVKSVSAISGIQNIQAAPVSAKESRNRNPNPYEKLDIKQQPKKLLYANDIMSTSVFYIDSKTRILDLPAIFKNKGFRHLPIVNQDSKIVGIVSDRDFYRYIYNNSKVADTDLIGEMMRTGILTALPETEIKILAELMFEEHIGCLPIIGEDQKIVGIVTRSDILRALLKHGPIELWG